MEENTHATAGVETGAQGATDDGNGQGQEENKTYSEKDFQSEVDRRVTEALKTAHTKWQTEYDEKLKAEKDEAARLAKMSADERAKAEFEKEKELFNNERSTYQRDKLVFECTKQLASENLSVEFAEILTGTDAESTKSNIDKFKTAFNKAVEASVEERLKGNTLPKSTNSSNDSLFASIRKGAGLS